MYPRAECFRFWGGRAIADIRRSNVHDLLNDVVDRGQMGTARNVREHLSRLSSWAVDQEILSESPLTGLKR